MTEGKPHILQPRFRGSARRERRDEFLYLLGAAELDERFAAGLRFAQAAFNFSLGRQIDVGIDLRGRSVRLCRDRPDCGRDWLGGRYDMGLLVAEGEHWTEFRGATGRDVGGEQRDEGEATRSPPRT